MANKWKVGDRVVTFDGSSVGRVESVNERGSIGVCWFHGPHAGHRTPDGAIHPDDVKPDEPQEPKDA